MTFGSEDFGGAGNLKGPAPSTKTGGTSSGTTFSSQAARWASPRPPGGGGGADVLGGLLADVSNERTTLVNGWVQLADVLLSADAGNITFSGIPTQYRHLYCVGALRSDRAATSDSVAIRFNSDSNSNYYGLSALIAHSNSLVTAERVAQNSIAIGDVAGATAAASEFSAIEFLMPDYANITRHKNIRSEGFAVLANSTTNLKITLGAGMWTGLAAIAGTTVFPLNGSNWVSGSRLTLYGYTP